jgi:broad specificity phosphatase PhoE
LTEQGREQAAELATQTNIFGDSRDTQELPQLLPFQSIYVSPLTRARETLSILLTHQEVCDDTNSSRHMTATNTTATAGGAPIIVLDNLREIDLYDWEGCHKDELNTKCPESYQAWKLGDPYNFVVPNSKNNSMDHNDEHENNNNNNETTTSRTATDQRYPLLELWERADQVWNEILQIERENDNSSTREQIMDGQQQQNTLVVAHGSLGQALLGTAMGYNASSFRQHEFPNCGMVEIQWHVCQSSSQYNQVANRWRWRWPTTSSEWTQHNNEII